MRVFASSVFLSTAAIGADTEPLPLSEEAFIGELPLVLTVTRLAQPKSETPAAVTLIDRDMIRASGVRKIPDLFWLVPGFQVGYDRANRATVTYHGFSDEFARRMQVLVDGRSVYSPLSGGVFWLDLPLVIDDIERIEVIRGPNAASYGSNSFLGAINIITRHASQEQGSFVKLAAGEHDVRDGVLRYGWGGHSRVTLSYQQDDGFDGLQDDLKIPIATFRGDYRLNPADTLELQLGVNTKKHGDGTFGNPTDPPRDANTTNHFQLLRWRHAFAAQNEVSLRFFHNYWNYDDDLVTDPINLGPFGIVPVPISYDGLEHRYDVELQHVFSPLPDWRFVWGGGTRLDRGRSLTYFNNNDWVDNRTHSLFGNVEWRLSPSSTANVGAMWEKHSLFGSEVSPRLAFNHHLSPQHTVRLAASQATRTPSLIEERANWTYKYQGIELEQFIKAMGGLRAETMTSYEIGYLGQMPAANLTADVRVFSDRMRDLNTELEFPAADLDGKVFNYRNEGRIDIVGAEIQLTYRPLPSTRFIFNYASMHADASDISAQANFTEEEHERSVPAFTWSVLTMHRFSSRWEGSLSYHRVGDMDWLGVGTFVNGYGRLDLRLARDYRFSGYKGQVAFTIQNLGPDTATIDREDVFDRRAFVTVSLHQ